MRKVSLDEAVRVYARGGIVTFETGEAVQSCTCKSITLARRAIMAACKYLKVKEFYV